MEKTVWDVDFESTDPRTLAALIGARNQLFEQVRRVPVLVQNTQVALAKTELE